jgi:hypothetical protein
LPSVAATKVVLSLTFSGNNYQYFREIEIFGTRSSLIDNITPNATVNTISEIAGTDFVINTNEKANGFIYCKGFGLRCRSVACCISYFSNDIAISNSINITCWYVDYAIC